MTLTEALFLAGRVIDPLGEPIAGAGVTPVLGDATYAAVVTHLTGAGGRFRIDHAEAATGRLHVQARGFAAVEVEVEASPEASLEASPEAETSPETGAEETASKPASIVLEPVATTDLTLTVRDARGRPVSDAEAFFSFHDERLGYHQTVVTDGAGRGRLDLVPLGGPCSLEVRHPEHPHWWRSDLVVEAGQHSLTVDLDPAPWKLVTVRGRASDGEDGPIPGVEVSLRWPHGSAQYQARADGQGRFELRRVKEGAYRLIATAPDRAPSSQQVKVAAGLEPLEVILGAGAVLRGSITGVASEQDEARVQAHWLSEMREAAVDGDRYRMDRLGAGRWSVSASVGQARVDAEIEIEPGQTEARLDFEFPAGHRVSGQLLIDGQPPPRPAVFLDTAPEAPVAGHHNVTLDAGGRFAFECVAAGSYHLSYHDETGMIRHPVRVDSDVDLFLDLATVPLRGRAVDAATGTGVAGVTVRALPEVYRSHGPRWETASDTAGWFELGRVLPGRWTLIVDAPGFLEQRREIGVAAMAEPKVLELVASEGLRLRVETSAALPYSVALLLRDSGGEQVASGHVTLAGSREGHWSQAPRGRFRLWASNELSWIETDAEIPGPVVTLRFPPAGALRLRVLELELEAEVPGRPPVPVQVAATLELPDDPAYDGPRHRRSRSLYLKSLTPGLWRVEVRTAGGRTWTASAPVVDGLSSEILLGMD